MFYRNIEFLFLSSSIQWKICLSLYISCKQTYILFQFWIGNIKDHIPSQITFQFQLKEIVFIFPTNEIDHMLQNIYIIHISSRNWNWTVTWNIFSLQISCLLFQRNMINGKIIVFPTYPIFVAFMCVMYCNFLTFSIWMNDIQIKCSRAIPLIKRMEKKIKLWPSSLFAFHEFAFFSSENYDTKIFHSK